MSVANAALSAAGKEETDLAMQAFFKELTTLLEQLRVLTMKSCQFQGLEERIASLEFKVESPKSEVRHHGEVSSEIPELGTRKVMHVMQGGAFDIDTEIQQMAPASYVEQLEDVTGANEEKKPVEARTKRKGPRRRPEPRKLGSSQEAKDKNVQMVEEEPLEINAVQPSILRAALQCFTMGFSDENAYLVVQEHGETDYINRIRDTAAQIGMLACLFLSFLHDQAIDAPKYEDKFETVYGTHVMYNLYLISTNLCAALLIVATVMSIGILVVMNTVRESKFNDWHDKCEIILRMPYLAMVYAFIAWSWSLTLLCRPLYGDRNKTGAFSQFAIILVTDLLIIVSMWKLVYSNQKVQAQGKHTE